MLSLVVVVEVVVVVVVVVEVVVVVAVVLLFCFKQGDVISQIAVKNSSSLLAVLMPGYEDARVPFDLNGYLTLYRFVRISDIVSNVGSLSATPSREMYGTT